MFYKFSTSALSIIVILLIIIVFKYRQRNETHSITLQQIENAYKENITSQFESWQLALDSLNNVLITNKEKHSCNLHDLLKDYTIIFYYTNKMCAPCVEKEMDMLSKFISKFPDANILIIGQTPPFDLPNSQVFSNKIWSCKNNLFNKHQLEEVPIIILTHDTSILNICHTNKMTNHSSQYFYLFMEKNYRLFANRIGK